MRTPLCITSWPCLGSNSELLPKITEFGVWRYYVLLYMRLLSILFCCFKGSIAFMLLRVYHIQLVIKQLIRKLHMFQEIWRKETILLKSKGFCKKKKKSVTTSCKLPEDSWPRKVSWAWHGLFRQLKEKKEHWGKFIFLTWYVLKLKCSDLRKHSPKNLHVS